MLPRESIYGWVNLLVVVLAATLIAVFVRPRVQKLISSREETQRTDSLFVFDPNTVTYEQLRALGIERQTAVGIIRYREAGKIFGIREDFALCYGISDSMYLRLQPYIVIGEEFALKPRSRTYRRDRDTTEVQRPHASRPQSGGRRPRYPFEPFGIDTVGVKYLRLIGFSTRQAEALIEYRERGRFGIRDLEELRDCYVVSDEMGDSLERYVVFRERDPHEGLVEINSADSATLRSVRGIGGRTVVAIMEFRRLLGGFYDVGQIRELKCVTAENFEQIIKQIYCDSCKISKIDINFAPASQLEYHPYISSEALRKLIKVRNSKGGWKSVGEMVEDKIFSDKVAAAIAPYLHFGEYPQDFD